LNSNTQLFLGIDGGGTGTRAFLMDSSGCRSAWGEAGPTNPNHIPVERVQASLQAAISSASARAGATPKECVSAFLGIAGVTTEAGRAQVRELLKNCGLDQARLGVDHDIRIALAGGLAGKPGIALIVGTGSSCYGRAADGHTWQTGGWEALISDEGSGYYLGREAIAAAARMADGRAAESPLRQRVFRWLEITTIAEVLPRIHDRGLSRSEIAAFAPELISLAAQGDPAASSILDNGARLLAELVEANFRKLPTGSTPQVVITGGLGTAQTLYREKIMTEIRKLLPSAEIVSPLLPPAIGAALLAFEQAGHSIHPELVNTLYAAVRPRE
jgi:N-acetylglucosamine kinase-like BadF-type ATPase